MPIDAEALRALVDSELEHLSDARVKAQIRRLLVASQPVLRDWDYGKPGEQFPCWPVLSDSTSNTGIAYCESDFGPRNPWGLVWLEGDEKQQMSMGMDCGWFPTFLDAYFDSRVAADLPIWRVLKTTSTGDREPITEENTWEAAWARVAECREADPASRYDCGHNIAYARPHG
jgi:hypothetical protein